MHYQYTAVFLDTSIFDGQQFNFESEAFKAFIAALKAQGIPLLLPDPTEREIRRHLRERAAEAVYSLEKVRRSAPFVVKWKAFSGQLDPNADLVTLRGLAEESLNAFLEDLKVERIGYKDLDLAKIMDSYDNGEAPFAAKGPKRKEFPDALSFELVQKWASKSFGTVAIVSADTDFQRACDRFSHVLHVDNLPQVTQNLLTDTAKVDSLLAIVDDDVEVLEKHILDILPGIEFYDARDSYDIVGVEVTKVQVFELAIVGLGKGGECTVFFYADLTSDLKVEWVSPHPRPAAVPSGMFPFHDDSAIVSGSAKLVVQNEKIESVRIIILDDDLAYVMSLPQYDLIR